MKNRCPNEETLADYMKNRLYGKDAAAVEEHISNCDLCMEQLVLIGTLEQQDCPDIMNAPKSVTSSAVNHVSSLNDTLWSKISKSVKEYWNWASDIIMPVPCHAVRGNKNSFTDSAIREKIYFGKINAQIEIEGTTVRVQITPKIQNIRVTLKNGDREVASYPFNDEDIVFNEVLPGSYHLDLIENGEVIGTYSFDLRF